MAWRFGDFTLDGERRQLLRAGTPLSLEPKAYELLGLLLARQPRALSKDQIHGVLWAGTFVSESALAGLVADLRSVLGDDARRPRFIRTVHGYGYAFCGEAREDGQPRVTPTEPVLRTLVLSGSGQPRSFDRAFDALTAALDEPAGAAVHVLEFTAGSRPPLLLQQLASLAQPTQVLLSRGAFDLVRDGADGRGDGLAWLAHGPYLFEGVSEPVEVFEVGRLGHSFLKPPPDTNGGRRALRPGDEATLGWRPALALTVPGRNEWTLLDKLGEGGFGEVWLAGHASGERRVFKFCFDASRLRGLKREATLFQILKDELGDRDDIAKVLDWNFDEPPYFLESEYTEGGSLADWGQAAGGITSVPLETRLELIAQVAEALAAAHSVGVLHKDVKPQNVLIAEDAEGKPKARLADFGVGIVRDKSILLGRDFTVTGFTEATKDANRNEGGTRLYAAPELLEGRTATTLADIYALGVVLYQVVVGDLERALAPGWERDVADDLLREDIGACVEGRPERRLGNAQVLAERLRSLKQRRTEHEAPYRSRRNRRVWTAVSAVAVAGLGAALFNLGERVAERPVPRFHRITFQRTAVAFARFSADGRTVIYDRWAGRPNEIFSVRLESVESRSLGLHANVAATAPGEMAVILPNRTLARLPLEGGMPREIVEDVEAADWGPDGSLAILRRTPLRIEFPLGHLLYEAGSDSLGENIRVSPRGDRVAFIESSSGESVEGLASSPGHLVVIDRQGRKLTSSEWTSIGGLAWSPDGNEIWFTATKTSFASALHAFSLAGRERLVAQMGETVYLHDISHDGRVLLAQGRVSAEARGRMALDDAERDYSWLDGTTGVRFSPDGRFFIFNEALDGGGPARRAYLRRTDGSPPVWLGNGTALDVSPDSKWVVCLSHGFPRELRLVPAGAGDARTLRRGMVDGYRQALFLPDGKRLVVVGNVGGRPRRLFVQELPDGEPRPFTPEGVSFATTTSPDGRFVAAHAIGADRFALYPVDGGEPHPIPGLAIRDVPLRFRADGAALFVSEPWLGAGTSLGIVRLDLATGRKSAWLDLRLPDTAAFLRTDPQGRPAQGIDITPDGRSYLYSYTRVVGDLYIVDGLR
jgi:serine/threonine protein kinase/DNA-binding winged helix-turn-helix (wHTH) protein